MNIRKILLDFLLKPYIVELVMSKVFKSSKRFAFQQMENALEEIQEYLLDKKKKLELSPNPYDEEVLNLGIAGLKEFSECLSRVLNEINPT